MENLIECKNLTLAYEGSIVLRDLSFDVRENEILLISGENGSGKSTTIKALLGLLKPIKGSVNITKKASGAIGYLPQQSKISKDFPATVREVVESGLVSQLKLGLFKPKDAAEKVERAMSLTGIKPIEKRCFNELSGGQQQRCLLARALCAAGKVLVLDEPTNALDGQASDDMYKIITMLRYHYGMSVVMVSHDIETCVGISDRVLHLCLEGAFVCESGDYYEKLEEVHSARVSCPCGHDH